MALEYRPDKGDERPRITATGSGAVAEQILHAAFASGVKVREDADLVEILALFEEDSLIPLEALAAVAEILAYVYRAENREPPAAAAPAAGPSSRPASPPQPGPDRAAGEPEKDLW
ncbi:EscU/YscU/HrcU family type III secretion system export apparatus switch protein [Marinibaculum pumilum]|uniref:EscU/YscU/HrcU family type III secretion system export apparatus switch protein n=1 Tax=Marinibaculum pumilum TaxID=1766165 RepID=A0ABV7KZH7_9PROT